MRKYPAESAGGAGALALIVGYALGIQDPEALVAIGSVLLLVPAAVTTLVNAGGVRGALGLLWRGRS